MPTPTKNTPSPVPKSPPDPERVVTVSVRSYSDAHIAKAGRGKGSKTASCTSNAEFAVERAAAKYFGCDVSQVAVTQTGNGETWQARFLGGTES